MRHRERREFTEICRHLAHDDPDLARLLTDRPDPVLAVAILIERGTLWARLVLLLGGILLDAPLAFGTGLVLSGTFWLPRQRARQDSPLDPGA